MCLKILSDHPEASRSGYLLEKLMDEYTAAHPEVTFQVEYLPDKDKAERENRLTSLRAEIMAGEGPDLYLLPEDAKWGLMLFNDVNVAIRNGVFHEISAYYNADDALIKEELNQAVMDAGTLGEARYVLPFAYNYQVLQVNETVLEEYGMDLEAVTATADGFVASLLDAIERTGETELANCAYYENSMGISYFSKYLDYEQEKVLISAEDVAQWLKQGQKLDLKLLELFNRDDYAWTDWGRTLSGYTLDGDTGWYGAGLPMYISGLQEALESAIIAKAEGEKITAYPVLSRDGTLTASVTYWGAVGSGCDYADVAYDFLREFLTRDTQWELDRNRVTMEKSKSLYWYGLPVRNKGAAEPLTNSYKIALGGIHANVDTDKGAFDSRLEKLNAVEMTDGDFPLMENQIDQVSFYSTHQKQLTSLRSSLYDRDGPTDVNIDSAAADFIRDLEFFLAES